MTIARAITTAVVLVLGAGCARGTSGTALKQPSAPPSLSGLSAGTAAMAYDPASHQVVLITENQGAGSETWTWDGTGWHQKTSDVSPPEAPLGDLMAYDPVSRQLLLFWPGAVPSCPAPALGQTFNCPSSPPETWTWDHDQWHHLSAATPSGSALALDPVRGRLLLVGYAPGNDSSCSLATWIWDGKAWIPAGLARAAADVILDGMVVDPATGNAVLMGEQSHDAAGLPSPGFCGDTMAELWRWNGSAWSGPTTNQGVPVGPLSLGADPGTDDVLALTAKGQTWTWDGHTWTQRHPAQSPGPRVRAALAYDPAHHRLVLFGGSEALAGDPVVPNGDTWTWDGSNWTHVATGTPTSTGPPG